MLTPGCELIRNECQSDVTVWREVLVSWSDVALSRVSVAWLDPRVA